MRWPLRHQQRRQPVDTVEDVDVCVVAETVAAEAVAASAPAWTVAPVQLRATVMAARATRREMRSASMGSTVWPPATSVCHRRDTQNMGFLTDVFKRPFFAAMKPGPLATDWPAEIMAIDPQGDGLATLHLRFWTGEESPWQAPGERTIRTVVPPGVQPQVGQRVLITPGRGRTSNEYVHWEKPAPDLPPMSFPQIADPNDPQAMISALQAMVGQGTLDQAGFERAKAYLEKGGW
jgi:hypothetical protein